jgi:hypothetical protein
VELETCFHFFGRGQNCFRLFPNIWGFGVTGNPVSDTKSPKQFKSH